MNEKLKARLESLKTNVKKNAPLIITAATTLVGTAGWVVAGIYAQKVKAMETVELDAWPSIEISPRVYDDFVNGATLMARQFEVAPNHTFVQITTSEDGFPAEADERFNKYNQAACTTTLNQDGR